MKNIREFKERREFDSYMLDNIKKYIGSGGEGDVYLNASGEVLKCMKLSSEPRYYSSSQDIIMEDDMPLESFMFPKELFILNDQIIGYKSNYFQGNIIKNNSDSFIDPDTLIKARNRMIKDIEVLTSKGYYLFELPRNLLFNNERLCAIDTLDYRRIENVSLEINTDILDYALALELGDYDESTSIDPHDNFDVVIQKIKTKNKES